MDLKQKLTEVQHVWTPNKARMSFFSAPVTNKRPNATVGLADIYGKVTGDSYKERTRMLRSIDNHTDAQKYKAISFDYVTFSGIFSYGNDASLEEHSQLLCIDFDGLEDPTPLRSLLLEDPYFETLLLFTSPSGKGVKWIIHIDTSMADHRIWFKLIESYMKETYDLTVDPKCINESRGCYLPYDPEAYISPMLLTPVHTDTHEVKAIAQELIAQGKDITAGYDNWLHLGFALADGLGAEGGELFHRLSRLNAEYDERQCEKQWQDCLKGKGQGVTIKTFYKMAKDAGIDISKANCQDFSNSQIFSDSQEWGNSEKLGLSQFLEDFCMDSQTEKNWENEKNRENQTEEEAENKKCFLETFSDKIDIDNLPELLRRIAIGQKDDINRDKMILGALTCFSGAMPSVFGVYDQRRVYPPFYTLVNAPAASDKGNLSSCRALLMPIEEEIRRMNQIEVDSSAHPEEVPYRSLFVPANSSATAAYEALGANGGAGVTFETEADTLSETLKSDYGNYSAGLRSAFHHEPISYNRRKDKEHVDILCPRWAILVTCTPDQVPGLLPSCNNGLASRFLFYNMPRKLYWRNVFEGGCNVIDDEYREIGEQYLRLYHQLQDRYDRPFQFVLTPAQQEQFNAYFESIQLEQVQLFGDDLIAFVRRLGLVCFRLAMILTVLRQASANSQLDPLSQTLICSDEDFQTAMTIINCLISHTTHVYVNLIPHPSQEESHSSTKSMSPGEKVLFDALPQEFTREMSLNIAKQLSISQSSAYRYVGKYLSFYHVVERQNGQYKKCA